MQLHDFFPDFAEMPFDKNLVKRQSDMHLEDKGRTTVHQFTDLLKSILSHFTHIM